MNSDKYDDILFIAHRGFAVQYPENTLTAFGQVIKQQRKNLLGIELDIQLTADGRVVVFHDNNLKRIGGRDIDVQTSNYDEIKDEIKNDAGFRKEKIPLLKETLALADHKTRLYIEIKEYNYDVDILCEKLKAMLTEYKPDHDIVLHSFSIPIMEKVIKVTEQLDVQYGFLFSGIIDELKMISNRLLEKMGYLHPNYKLLFSHQKTLLGYAKPMNIWTVNSKEELERLKSLKVFDYVEGVMTDDERLTRED